MKRRKPPAPYKSMFEYKVHNMMSRHEYEPAWATVQYTVPKIYKPDFASKRHKGVVYEAKGRMRTFEEAAKYLHVRQCNPDIEIRFIIMNPNVKAYPQTKLRLGDWLTKHGFAWCTINDIPKGWL